MTSAANRVAQVQAQAPGNAAKFTTNCPRNDTPSSQPSLTHISA